ncbi:MAG: hypothetical protein K2O22_04790 [Anaeroplasmataceae bacterium]|nr:hypothetical protein [Anaeroplasmataceae bacterium]
MKYKFIGFKGKNNPSFYIVSKFQESFLLTNSLKGIEKDLENIEDCLDGILLFGLKPKLKNQIQVECSYKLNNKVHSTNFNLSQLESIFQDMEVIYNDFPSNYLCNYAYGLLCKKFKGNVILIHVPFSKDYAEKIIQCLQKLS